MNEFKNLVSNYKPKQSVLEIGIVKTKDLERIQAFKETKSEQNGAQRYKA